MNNPNTSTENLLSNFEKAERNETRKGQLYRSRGSLESFYLMLRRSNGFKWQYAEKWSHSYRATFTSSMINAIVTYCEGDWILHISDDQESFESNIKHAIQFYETEKN